MTSEMPCSPTASRRSHHTVAWPSPVRRLERVGGEGSERLVGRGAHEAPERSRSLPALVYVNCGIEEGGSGRGGGLCCALTSLCDAKAQHGARSRFDPGLRDQSATGSRCGRSGSLNARRTRASAPSRRRSLRHAGARVTTLRHTARATPWDAHAAACCRAPAARRRRGRRHPGRGRRAPSSRSRVTPVSAQIRAAAAAGSSPSAAASASCSRGKRRASAGIVCGSMIAFAAPWPATPVADERLRHHVVQPEAGAVDRVAREQRAERELVAVGLGAGERADEPAGRVVRGERRDRVARGRARSLDRVAERVERAGRQLGHRLGRRQRRVVDDDRAAHARRRLVDALGVPVPARHLRPRQRGRDRHRPRAVAARRGDRLGHVDHAAAAERDDAPVAARPHAAPPRRAPARARRARGARVPPPPPRPAAAPRRAASSAAGTRDRRAPSTAVSAAPRPNRMVRSPSRHVKLVIRCIISRSHVSICADALRG